MKDGDRHGKLDDKGSYGDKDARSPVHPTRKKDAEGREKGKDNDQQGKMFNRTEHLEPG
jgi:hypothetical protein